MNIAGRSKSGAIARRRTHDFGEAELRRKSEPHRQFLLFTSEEGLRFMAEARVLATLRPGRGSF